MIPLRRHTDKSTIGPIEKTLIAIYLTFIFGAYAASAIYWIWRFGKFLFTGE